MKDVINSLSGRELQNAFKATTFKKPGSTLTIAHKLAIDMSSTEAGTTDTWLFHNHGQFPLFIQNIDSVGYG